MNSTEYVLEKRFKEEHLSIFSRETVFAAQAVLSAALSIKTIDISSDVRTKEGVNNFVTAWDLASEKIIMDLIKKEYPNMPILSEESAPEMQDSLGEKELWVIDPLDGTTNAFYNRGYSCIATALVKHGKPYNCAVYNPTRDELFYAERGIGTFLNGKKIKFDKEIDLNKASICADTAYDPSIILFHIGLLKASRPSWISARGSGILTMAEIAAGRYNLYFNAETKPWDNAPGFALIEMAGGIYRGLDGRKIDIYSRDIVVGKQELIDQFVERITPELKDYKFVSKTYD